jgi:hypothetical protein
MTAMSTYGWSASARIGYFTGPREPNGCRLWTGSIAGRYPLISIADAARPSGRRSVTVGRLILGLTSDDPRVAMHTCDNGRCVEPSHLRVGTATDNMQDMKRKDRHLRGERAPRAVLTEADVRAIRSQYASGTPMTKIAPMFGVARPTIHKIISRIRWRHVE